MSDHTYLCELLGLGPERSHELADVLVEEEEKRSRDEEENLALDAGCLVQLVWLTGDTPAKVVRVEFNKILEKPLSFTGFNRLQGRSMDDPGQWFVDKGYTVRSLRTNGHWVQVVFGRGNLVRSEMLEYLRKHTGLPFDESEVDDGHCQAFGVA